jgi:hypothetical protein
MSSTTSSTSKLYAPERIPEKKVLKVWIAIGSLLLIAAFVMIAYSFYVDVISPVYIKEYLTEFTSKSTFVGGNGEVIGRGIMFYYWAPPLLIGLLAAAVSYDEFEKYYRVVSKGKIVDFSESSSLFGNTYKVHIKGYTRAREYREYARRVSSKTYYDYQRGEQINFD